MTITKKFKKIGILFLAVIALSSVAFGAINVLRGTFAAEINYDGEPLKTEYLLGTEFTIPTATLSGTSSPAEGMLVFPSGKESRESAVKLSEYGKYTLVYTANSVGVKITATDTFFTVKPLIENAVNAEYKRVEYKNIDDIRNGENTYERAGNAIVTDIPQESAPLYVNRPINVAASGPRDAIIKFGIPGDKTENTELSQLFIKVADAGDPDTYFEVRIIASSRTLYYAVANSANDGFSWENHIRFTSNVSKGKGVKRYADVYANLGAYVVEHIYGLYTGQIIYDKADNAVYTVSEEVGGIQYKKIADFDDPEQYDNVWGGFKSENVVVSICGANSASEFIIPGKAKLAIEEIGGVPVDENTLGETVRDTNNPFIEINYGEYSHDSLPMGVVGEPYPVFGATVYDDCSASLLPFIRVYYAYGTTQQKTVHVTNDFFSPDRMGEYTIVYRAKDYSGNEYETRVIIQAYEALSYEDGATVSVKVEDSYLVNDSLSVNPTMNIGNKSVTPDIVLYLPSGGFDVIKSDEEITLNEIGLYTMNFVYQEGEKVYRVQKRFFAVNSAFDNVCGAKEPEYGEVFFENVDFYGGFGTDYKRTGKAILVDLSPSSSPLFFTESFDLSGSEGNLSSLIKLGIPGSKYPQTTENAVRNGVLFVKIADAANPETFFKIRITICGFTWYFSAGNSSNELFGGEINPPVVGARSVYKNLPEYPATWGQCGGAVITNIYGLPVTEILYDRANAAVYVTREDNTGTKYVKIADFNDRNQFDSPWEGFDSGKVNVSVYYGDKPVVPTEGSSKIAIESAGGKSAAQIVREGGVALGEAEARIEFVDFDGYKDVAVSAEDVAIVKGVYYGYEYPLENVRYAFYKTENGAEILVSEAKTYTPQSKGLYKLKIYAIDYFGNETTAYKYFGVSDGADVRKAVLTGEPFTSGVVGDKITLPARSIKVGNSEQSATVTVYYPDGNAYRNDNLYLSVAGVYTAEYTAVIDGVKYVVTERIIVKEKLYSSDSAEYVQSEGIYPAGVRVTLNQGETITYKKTINVHELNNEKLIFEIAVKPKEFKVPDFSRFVFRLTDVYDESNWVEIVATESTSIYQGLNTYSLKLPGQPRAAMNNWNDVIYKDSEDSGAYTNTPFAGNISGAANCVPFGAWYDPAEKIMYCYNPAGTPSKLFIADLDDKKYFNTPFKGFTTGEVRLSFRAENFATAESVGTAIVNAVAGEKVTDASCFADEIAPVIFTGDGNVPKGAVNLGYKLPVYRTADDVNGNTPLKVRVYYGYYGNNPVDVAVNNGRFIPRFGGVYTAVYTTCDYFGNEAVYTLDIEIENTARSIFISIPDDKIEEASLGEKVKTARAIYGGGYGSLSLKTTVIAPDGSEISLSAGDGFAASVAGAYKVRYTVTDYHGQTAENEYQVVVKESENPVFVSELGGLPKYLILNNGVTLPTFDAMIYVNGKAEKAVVEIWVKDAASSDFVKLDGNYYVPFVNNSGDFAEIVYYAISGDKKTEISFEIPVIDVGYAKDDNHEIDIVKFFETENAALVADEECVTATFGTEARIGFINPVLSPSFILKLAAEEQKFDANEFTIRLADYANTDAQLTIKFVKDGEWKMQIGSGRTVSIGSLFDGITDIRLLNGEKTLSVNNAEYDVYDLTDGAFAGFASKKIYVSMEFSSVVGQTTLKLLQLNNQSLQKIYNDTVSPEFYTEQITGGLFEKGSVYKLKPAYACDVLDQGIITGLTVKMPGNKYAVAMDGTILKDAPFDKEYEIVLDYYGVYSITYSVSASVFSGKRGLPYTITVRDKEAPSAEIVGATSGTAKVNEVITLPEIIVKDNYTPEDRITVEKFIISPDDIIIRIDGDTVGNKNCLDGNVLSETNFKATQKGVYRILFKVTDAAGNVAYAEYRLTVN